MVEEPRKPPLTPEETALTFVRLATLCDPTDDSVAAIGKHTLEDLYARRKECKTNGDTCGYQILDKAITYLESLISSQRLFTTYIKTRDEEIKKESDFRRSAMLVAAGTVTLTGIVETIKNLIETANAVGSASFWIGVGVSAVSGVYLASHLIKNFINARIRKKEENERCRLIFEEWKNVVDNAVRAGMYIFEECAKLPEYAEYLGRNYSQYFQILEEAKKNAEDIAKMFGERQGKLHLQKAQEAAREWLENQIRGSVIAVFPVPQVAKPNPKNLAG
ncbi:MAG: hypothetical protein QXP42_00800 [Candidatus Micrarchaeia archaeon]